MKMPFRWDSFTNHPTWIGVLNITPNSFSDGGQFLDPSSALRQAQQLLHDGAAILDLGAEASSFFRPGVQPVDAPQQWQRIEPVLQKLVDAATVSVDTRSADVAQKSLSAGAQIINDISAGTHDPELLPAVATGQGAIVLMHIGPSFPDNPPTDDPQILATVKRYLAQRIDAAIQAGIPRSRIAIDPGVGFGKTMADNWRLALAAANLRDLGVEVILGLSRKRFLTSPPPIPPWQHEFEQALEAIQKTPSADIHERDAATAAALMAVRRGVRIHRVHNVSLCAATCR